jgi:hypothetical protein
VIGAVTYFLLVFDRRKRRLTAEPREFADSAAAVRARFEVEASDHDPDLEVVVLGAASREALEKTHSRYFGVVSAFVG